MSLSTITAVTKDTAGEPDNTEWVFASELRGADGKIITGRPRTVKPVAGQLTVQLEPGPTMVQFGGRKWTILVPDHDEDLWVLLSVAIGVPINTSADLLAAAVETFVENNPGYPWSGLAGKPAVIGAGSTQHEARQALGSGVFGEVLFAAATDAAARLAVGIDTFFAYSYGVRADGAEHNNVANLLDCCAQAYAAGAREIILPGGDFINTDDADLGTVTADSGRTYTNNGGIPLPVNQAVTIRGCGKGVTTIQQSPGFLRAFDAWYTADGQTFDGITLRDFTVDRNSLTGLDIGPLTATTGAITLAENAWTTLPGISATTFKNCRLVFFPASNSGTAAGKKLKARVSGSNFQVYTTTSYTVSSGDQVRGALRDHVIAGTHVGGGSGNGFNMTIRNILIEDVDAINVTSSSYVGLGTPFADEAYGTAFYVQQNPDNAVMTPTVTNVRTNRCRVEGGAYGFLFTSGPGCHVDEAWATDCYHDTGVDAPGNWASVNFFFGGGATVGRAGVRNCVGKRSGDPALEVDQWWDFTMEDCRWEDSYNGVYRTNFVPPARTAAGAKTTTLAGSLSSGASSTTVAALPDQVDREGWALIDTEVIRYKATTTAGTAWSIWRGQNGSTAASHSSGATVTFIEVGKQRFHAVRTKITNDGIMALSGGGYGFNAFTNAALPFGGLTIRDCKYESIGGSPRRGQVVTWQGWTPYLDMEGMRVHIGSLLSTTSGGTVSSCVEWVDQYSAAAQAAGVALPPVQIRGRNNHFRVSGKLNATSNGAYAILRLWNGYSLLDFDFFGEIALSGMDGTTNPYLAYLTGWAGYGGATATLAPGSRLGLRGRIPSGIDTAPSPPAVLLDSNIYTSILDSLRLDLDLTEWTTAAATPWSIHANQRSKVRFGDADPVVTVSTTITLPAGLGRSYTYLLASGAAVTMPTAVANQAVYHLKNIHTANLTIGTTSSQTIDGATTLTLAPDEAVTLRGDNSNWRIF